MMLKLIRLLLLLLPLLLLALHLLLLLVRRGARGAYDGHPEVDGGGRGAP